ncbi:MAG: hypothetical protein KIT34_02410 [Cyanobacteria bacterium TGS_CYA1]|nr:hypothetical protein [Cyanobacteria bacterium TGS_CYA1]
MKVAKIDNHQIAFETGFAPHHIVFALIVISCGVFLFQVSEISFGLRIAAIAFSFVFAIFLVSHRSRMVFDSNKQEVTISEGRLVQSLKASIPFSEIKSIIFEKSRLNNDGFGRYILRLENREIPFSSSSHKVGSDIRLEIKKLISLIGCEEIVIEKRMSSTNRINQSSQAIQTFDFSNVDPEVIELIRRKRLIDAIKLVRDQTGYGLKDSKELVEEIQRRLNSGSL